MGKRRRDEETKRRSGGLRTLGVLCYSLAAFGCGEDDLPSCRGLSDAAGPSFLLEFAEAARTTDQREFVVPGDDDTVWIWMQPDIAQGLETTFEDLVSKTSLTDRQARAVDSVTVYGFEHPLLVKLVGGQIVCADWVTNQLYFEQWPLEFRGGSVLRLNNRGGDHVSMAEVVE